ncbi:hypothetical protein AB4144_22435, partial [Rhizobiaceae sp. 2RAB30]
MRNEAIGNRGFAFISKALELGPALAIFLAVGVAWELAVKVFSIPGYLLPAPSAIAVKMFEARAMLFENLVSTMTAAILGFIIGTTVA